MKKVLAGCLIVLAIALVGFGVAGFYAFRWARPMIESTANYLDRAREMSRLADRITNKSPYVSPQTGQLTATQVERFVAVQTRVRDELGERWSAIETKSAEIRQKATEGTDRRVRGRDLTLAEFTSVFSDLAGIYTEARRAQVNALNIHKFSDAEYTWVRRRVYEAAGMEIAGGIDLSKFEELAREGAMKSSVMLPDLPKPKVPEANIKLVKPHLAKIKEWVPMAFLGL
ncbi:MAG: hypothetical protein WD690_01080 [Vicinamibacterales bacterium]